MKDRSNEITLEEKRDIIARLQRSEIVLGIVGECKGLHEKLVLLCMMIDAIAYTEDITHEQMYKMFDEIKPIIGSVNKKLGKGGIIP